MRKIIDLQTKIGQLNISDIKFDLSSRDEIPQLLMGLQAIYSNPVSKKAIIEALKEKLGKNIDFHNGRPGMDLWKILVLGTIRLCCNWDFDKVHEMANNHIKLRQMLGHCPDDIENQYKLQTIKDNLALFTPEMMDRINQIAINHGHLLIGNQARKGLNVSYDSFVEETDVHFPMDISLLWDALRKAIYLIMAVCAELDLSQWCQGEHHLRKLKRMFRKIQKLKRSNSKDSEKKAQREHQIKCAYRECLKQANMLVEKIKATLSFYKK